MIGYYHFDKYGQCYGWNLKNNFPDAIDSDIIVRGPQPPAGKIVTYEPNTSSITIEDDPEELAYAAIKQRNALFLDALIEGIDLDIIADSEIKAYCQALRDIENQEDFPNTIEWPAKPKQIER